MPGGFEVPSAPYVQSVADVNKDRTGNHWSIQPDLVVRDRLIVRVCRWTDLKPAFSLLEQQRQAAYRIESWSDKGLMP